MFISRRFYYAPTTVLQDRLDVISNLYRAYVFVVNRKYHIFITFTFRDLLRDFRELEGYHPKVELFCVSSLL